MARIAEIKRKTKETDIDIILNIDGRGTSNIKSGIGFLDHMLNSLATHARWDLNLTCNGDVDVDDHHSAEDIGICLGMAISKALDDKKGLVRFADCYIPMDEALGFCSIDISGRPFLVFNCDFSSPKVGSFDTQLFEEFFRALAFNAGLTVHLKTIYGKNDHHKAESIFKAFAISFKKAVEKSGFDDFSSSKGVI